MRKFEEFFGHKYDIISQMATILAEAQENFDAGNMSRSEFNEIAKDLLEFVDLDELNNDVDKKMAIKEAIEILKFIVEHIPFS